MAGVAALGTTAVLFAMFGRSDAQAAPVAAPVAQPATPGAIPILVELFTSEGCSSCPSADETLTKLEQTQPVTGARIIVLAHHVDYWDYLGWSDPWSSANATVRQKSFASLHASSYTPQAVIDGRSEGIGSRSSFIEQKVAEAAKSSHVTVDVDLARTEKSTFDVNVRTSALPADTDVFIAVVQDRGRTDVRTGENSGRTLDHTSIVRSMTPGPKARITIPKSINAPAGGSTFSVVAFAQSRASRAILGSNTTRVP